MNSILKNMARISLFLAISVGAMANLDEGRWVPKNREVLDKVISESKNQGNYAVFDWDYTSIYQDTQENLFRYQIDKEPKDKKYHEKNFHLLLHIEMLTFL